MRLPLSLAVKFIPKLGLSSVLFTEMVQELCLNGFKVTSLVWMWIFLEDIDDFEAIEGVRVTKEQELGRSALTQIWHNLIKKLYLFFI